jgi:hypothetical protein
MGYTRTGPTLKVPTLNRTPSVSTVSTSACSVLSESENGQSLFGGEVGGVEHWAALHQTPGSPLFSKSPQAWKRGVHRTESASSITSPGQPSEALDSTWDVRPNSLQASPCVTARSSIWQTSPVKSGDAPVQFSYEVSEPLDSTRDVPPAPASPCITARSSIWQTSPVKIGDAPVQFSYEVSEPLDSIRDVPPPPDSPCVTARSSIWRTSPAQEGIAPADFDYEV